MKFIKFLTDWLTYRKMRKKTEKLKKKHVGGI